MSDYASFNVIKGNYEINEFRGYNATPARLNSELSEMMNLSSRRYPYLSPRKPREKIELPEGIQNIEKIFRANGKLCYIADGGVWYDGKRVGRVKPGKDKSIAICNGKICIAPDLVCYDYLKDVFYHMSGDITIVLSYHRQVCFDGNSVRLVEVTSTTTDAPFDWQKYMKVGDSVKTFNYIEDNYQTEGMIVSGFSDDGNVFYLKHEDGTDANFTRTIFSTTIVINDSRGIVVEHMICDNPAETGTYIFEMGDTQYTPGSATRNTMKKFAKYFFNFEKGEDVSVGKRTAPDSFVRCNITNINATDSEISLTLSYDSNLPNTMDSFTITRNIPAMNYICEKDNRLFGVCNSDNTVVSSRLGVPLDFRCFSGTSIDSYSVEVGSDGEFTGIVNYDGNVILFKERHIHMLSGTKPSLYRLSGIETYGAGTGCSGSICAIGGRLYYKSNGGVYVFSGSYPRCISDVFPDMVYKSAFAADDDRRYYLSMEDKDGRRCLYVYDTETEFWHIEDCDGAVSMCELSGQIYLAHRDMVTEFSKGSNGVSWYGVFGPFDLYTENKKVISSVSIRHKLPEGSSLRIEVSYDNAPFEVVKEIFSGTSSVLSCEIPLRRCHEFSLRFSGCGDIDIKGISMKLREGAGSNW